MVGNQFPLCCTNVAVPGDACRDQYIFTPGWPGRGADAWLTAYFLVVAPKLIEGGVYHPDEHIHIDRGSDGWNRVVIGVMCIRVILGMVGTVTLGVCAFASCLYRLLTCHTPPELLTQFAFAVRISRPHK